MIKIEVHDQAVRTALAALQARVNNLQPLLGDIGEAIVQRAKARFNTSSGPDGSTWRPKRQADGRKTLIGPSGDLRRQIVSRATAQAVVVQATAKYAAIHQFGGSIERPAYSKLVRHRTDAKGDLLRSAIIKNAAGQARGLVFAMNSHKATRVKERWFEVAAHRIKIPARPFLPVRADGSLYPAEQAEIMVQINAWLAGGVGA